MSGKFHKVVVASDSFKGCLTSMQVAEGVEKGIRMCCPDCQVVKLAVADGGEGTVDALLETMGGRRIAVEVSDPLGRPCMAEYAILNDGVTAVMEMSSASGLTLLKPEERNPLLTSTYGTGQMIADALDRGCRRFLIGIGGSATNDAGMGMMEALGFRFLDKNGYILRGAGESLEKVCSIDASYVHAGLSESQFIVACDVDSPLYGPDGAAYVFAPQKGADEAMVVRLDRGLTHFSEIIKEFNGKDVSTLPGAGAAGGLGGGFVAFLGARLERGIEMVLDAIHFDSVISGADLVITGEGRIDSQTLTGKTPLGVMNRARRQQIPVVAIGGSVTLTDDETANAGFKAVAAVTPEGMPLADAMNPVIAARNVSSAVRSLILKIK